MPGPAARQRPAAADLRRLRAPPRPHGQWALAQEGATVVATDLATEGLRYASEGVAYRRRDANVAATPLARTGSTGDVAPLVVYLVSDESAFVSGAEITVDGGLTAHGGAKALSDASRQHGP